MDGEDGANLLFAVEANVSPLSPLTADVASRSGWAQVVHRAPASAVTVRKRAALVPAHPPSSPAPALSVRAD